MRYSAGTAAAATAKSLVHPSLMCSAWMITPATMLSNTNEQVATSRSPGVEAPPGVSATRAGDGVVAILTVELDDVTLAKGCWVLCEGGRNGERNIWCLTMSH